MRIAAFTSITAGYLPNARLLVASLAKHQPDWDFHLLLNDRTPPHLKWDEEPFVHVTFAEWLPNPRPWLRFAYGYSVMEFCTATKGTMAKHLLGDLGYDAVVYLDPDTYLFSPLLEVSEILAAGGAEVILTPHLTDPESSDDRQEIWYHEIPVLKHGVFNLGFFVIRKGMQGLKVLDWWERRLLDYSHIDFTLGTFTDQKWMNLVPFLFEGVHILRDCTYNVARWNMKTRKIGRTENLTWTVNGLPLRFYHFSGLGTNIAWAKTELAMFGTEGDRTEELWQCYEEWYKAQGAKNVSGRDPAPWRWSLDAFGRKIDKDMRNAMLRPDVVDPFRVLS
jgi:hypothetical protein